VADQALRSSLKEKTDRLTETKGERDKADRAFRAFVHDQEQNKVTAEVHRKFLKRNFLDQIEDHKQRTSHAQQLNMILER